MKSFDLDTLAMFDAGAIDERDMFMFDLPSGVYGFWSGREPFVYQGVEFQGGSSLIEVGTISGAIGLTASAVELRLSAIPDTELDPDVLASIELEQYHQRPVTLSVAYIHPDTRALLSVERMFRGYLDQIDHDQSVGQPYALVARLESKSRNNQSRGFRMRGNADQRLVDVDDGGLQMVGQTGEVTLQWGRVSERPVMVPSDKRDS